MSIKNWPGGIIRPVPVAPAGPFQNGAAPGVWTLDQVAFWQRQGLWPIAGNVAPRGLFGGGFNSPTPVYNVIDYINIAAAGNALDFGDLTRSNASYLASFSSSTRGVWANGADGTSNLTGVNVIDYVTIMSLGNAIDFGDTTTRSTYCAGSSNSTRGIIVIGFTVSPVANSNIIEYVTIASTGNSLDFGDLTVSRRAPTSCASPTRALISGGIDSGQTNIIDYITISTIGNAIDFGDLTVIQSINASVSSATRAVIGGGGNNVLSYVTIASTGNAIDFGDLTRDGPDYGNGGCSSSTRGVFGGNGAASNNIEFITIATLGNSSIFGNLSLSRIALGACSSAHGGL